MADRRKADAWTVLLSRFALPFVQEAGEQLKTHRGATPRIVLGVGQGGREWCLRQLWLQSALAI